MTTPMTSNAELIEDAEIERIARAIEEMPTHPPGGCREAVSRDLVRKVLEASRITALEERITKLSEALEKAKTLLCCSRANVDSTMRPLYDNAEHDAVLAQVDDALGHDDYCGIVVMGDDVGDTSEEEK